MSDELRIRETDITTDDGQLIHFAYDEEGDIMEIVFNDRQATCAVELTDNILLRFNLEGRQAIGLTLLDFSVLSSQPR